jgi:valyl-tRNA synthetase
MKIELNKAYSPQESEGEIYKKWDESGYFNPDNLLLPEDAKTYTIVLPPPNITDRLHMGHTAMVAIEDLLTRYHRLLGERALWVPGTDHAAIATQNVVEKRLLKEQGKTRQDLGRVKFLKEVDKFLEITQKEILQQIRELGASMDWSRLAFTLDAERQIAVKTMFKNMFDEGVIYRGERIVNWCPRCHSTLADDEVEYKEEKAKLYWVKYGPFILATSRPETKLGDTAVAVYPGDERYQQFVGKELDIEGVLGKFKVTVVADRAVDMNFGSGAIKVTPAHSFVDSEIAQRHNLPSKKIINEDGRMMDNCGKYAGLTTREAREEIVKDMEALGLMDHIDEDYEHSAAVCYRCGTIIEPLPSKQWFIAVDKKIARLGNKSLKEKAIAAAEKGEIEFVPERFTKRYLDWMNNLHDWCISRQIWFGHQIPVWYKGEEVYVGLTAPTGDGWVQDPDTLDTWFSSGMWTFSTLGWPKNFIDGKKIGDLAKFHPTQCLETGYEIITLWVSRMIMMSFFALDEIPFEKVYLHGMILDKDGKKMSKSKGNGVNPVDMINKFGADATRLSILMGSTPGNDSRFSEDKVETKRNLINKLWNISRFILTSVDEKFYLTPNDKIPLTQTKADKWIIWEMNNLIAKTTEHLNSFDFSLAADDLTQFTWDTLADWYLEISKFEKDKDEILIYLLKNLLILWHPFIPFVTEKIWSNFNEDLLMVKKWPQEMAVDKKLTEEMAGASQATAKIIQVIQKIREARAENKIEPNKKVKAVIYAHQDLPLLTGQEVLIKSLKTGIEDLEIKANGEKITGTIHIVAGETEIYLLGAIDEEKEKSRLLKERTNLEKLIAIQETKLSQADFISRAPEAIVAAEKDKLKNYQLELAKIVANISHL